MIRCQAALPDDVHRGIWLKQYSLHAEHSEVSASKPNKSTLTQGWNSLPISDDCLIGFLGYRLLKLIIQGRAHPLQPFPDALHLSSKCFMLF
ncbi:hypothetical protein A1359_06940 [Methylomonas lenta]|uniref:Uncharacterized protein n=1 Tax=Methylomonas lenta TaxID=980561 RepID=A0A177NGE9_9GAMM|nr:hypothetical protein A1359_06940 [Methylomonas lenta]